MKFSDKLRWLFKISGIPLILFKDGLIVEDFGGVAFTPNPAVLFMKEVCAEHPVCYTVSPEFLLLGSVSLDDYCVALGPAAMMPITKKQAQELITRLGMSQNLSDSFLFRINSYPQCQKGRFTAALTGIYLLAKGHEPPEVYLKPFEIPSGITSPLTDPILGENSQTKEFSQKALYCVYRGDVMGLEKLLDILPTLNIDFPYMATDSIRSFKNNFILSVTMVAQAALSGGLERSVSGELTEWYIRQIEAFERYDDIWLFTRNMMLDYTRRVARIRLYADASPVVYRICKYVAANLHKKISVKGIAEHLDMNRSYLSRHFSEKTGKTIGEYVTEMKLSEARMLLIKSEMPLVDISSRLGFSSQNYFQTFFKQKTGTTPGVFRISGNL